MCVSYWDNDWIECNKVKDNVNKCIVCAREDIENERAMKREPLSAKLVPSQCGRSRLDKAWEFSSTQSTWAGPVHQPAINILTPGGRMRYLLRRILCWPGSIHILTYTAHHQLISRIHPTQAIRHNRDSKSL